MLLRDSKRPTPQAILIGTPTFGRVSCYWHQSMSELMRAGKPMNRAIVERMVKGERVDAARDLIVEHALSLEEPRISHVFFTDDDMAFPHDALLRLLAHDLPIVSALYYAKTVAPQPLMLADEYGGLVTDWPDGELVPCRAHGMGCTLIAREVFEAIEPPWFQTMDGEAVEAEFRTETEDVYFCRKAIEAGYQPTVDTSLLALHYDHRIDSGFPPKAWAQYVNGVEPTVTV